MIASLLVPTVIIHTAVHKATHVFEKSPKPMLAKWGPCGVGLALIPLMPFIDHPMEWLIEECESPIEGVESRVTCPYMVIIGH